MIHKADLEQPRGESKNSGGYGSAIDGDPNTFWHTQWKNRSEGFPHTIDVQVAENPVKLCGHVYTGRAGDVPNGRVKGYELYVSNDGQNWGEPVAKGELKDTAEPQFIGLNGVTAAYVRLKGLSAQPSALDQQVMSAAEIQIVKVP